MPVRDSDVTVDALVMNSGGRMGKTFDSLLNSLATRVMNRELETAVDGDDEEEKSERSQHIARAKRGMQQAIQVARIRSQVSMIWAVCPSTNDRRVSNRRNRGVMERWSSLNVVGRAGNSPGSGQGGAPGSGQGVPPGREIPRLRPGKFPHFVL